MQQHRQPDLLTGVWFGHAIADRPLDQAACLLQAAVFTDQVRDGSSVGRIGIVIVTEPLSHVEA
jgi:hypothetical protein